MKTLSILLVAFALTSTHRAEAADPPRRRVVVVEPVVLCDDDGTHPARWKLAKKLVDRVYTRSDLEFVYTEPRFWGYSKGRLGQVNLDTIVKEATRQRVIRGGKRVVTMFFVDAIDGRAKLMGRGKQNGNITFVCLGKDEVKEPVLNFVIAHEVGHNFNLRHAVDDPKVPDDVPNLQGDGPFEKRLAVDGLTEYQRDEVLKSPLVRERIEFADTNEALEILREELARGSLEGSSANYLRFTLGVKKLSDDQASANREAESLLKECVRPFTQAEQATMRKAIAEIAADHDKSWPLLTRFPWSFVKVKGGFCSSFSHTRGLHIFFAEPVVTRLMSNPQKLRELLLHEKLHVLQRLYPRRFEKLAEYYGFHSVLGASLPTELVAYEVPNPDASGTYWALRHAGKLSFL
ncbi:MAG: hypothetical protein AAF517_03535 [Planctomycetota bacterium]